MYLLTDVNTKKAAMFEYCYRPGLLLLKLTKISIRVWKISFNFKDYRY